MLIDLYRILFFLAKIILKIYGRESMRNIKLSSFLLTLLAIFLIADIIGYRLLYTNMLANHEKETQILFYKIKAETSDLLSKLVFNYKIQEKILLEKHRIVETYLKTHDLNSSLKEIYEKINAGHPDKPYDIYISDKNLIIRNTTYKMDDGYDLTFAKDVFELHKEQNITGCSTPIREKKSDNFLSYTDSYLTRNGDERAAVLELSYTYRNTAESIQDIENMIAEYPNIVAAKAYSLGQGDFVYELMLKNDPTYKRTSNEIITAKHRAEALAKKLKKNDLFKKKIEKDGKHYLQLYMLAKNPISNQVRILYSILLDESKFYAQLYRLNFLILFISFLGIVAIFFLAKIRIKEERLSEQDSFVQSVMHEIKTPLSVITLNNELRQIEYGTDPYGEEIDSALKVLHNTYNSMSYIITKEKLQYQPETLELKSILKDRIDFFQTIATANKKKIVYEIDSECRTDISLIELMRLIDNNLSNAIKYSYPSTQVKVLLKENTLSFHTQSDVIKDGKKIFNKYVRENTTVGGYGLGLNIVKEIAEQYDIKIGLISDEKKGTTFIYRFKCHSDDISSW